MVKEEGTYVKAERGVVVQRTRSRGRKLRRVCS